MQGAMIIKAFLTEQIKTFDSLCDNSHCTKFYVDQDKLLAIEGCNVGFVYRCAQHIMQVGTFKVCVLYSIDDQYGQAATSVILEVEN